tara:strand:- start:90 stop:809 length:720 start_codon:yes stop_codon:yes gene_type:complete
MLIDLNKLYYNYNLHITGVIHIGAHLGQEYNDYTKLNIKNMMFFEPQKEIFKQLKSNVGKSSSIQLHNIALGNEVGQKKMYIDSYNQGSSSILKPRKHLKQYPHIKFEKEIIIDINKLDNILNKDHLFNFINIDVQGFELEVFKGAKRTLDNIDYIYSEVNRDEVYDNCAKVDELDDFLLNYNFKRIETNWKGKTWGDAFYIKLNEDIICKSNKEIKKLIYRCNGSIYKKILNKLKELI